MTKFKFLIAIVLIVVVAYTGAWFFGANQISTELDKFASANAQPQISCDERSISGFPFRYDVTCKNTNIIDGDDQYLVQEIKATVRVYSPTHIIAFAQSPINLRNEFTGSERELDFTSLQLSARLNWSLELERVSAIADNLKWSDTLITPIELANAKNVEAHLIATQDAETGIQAFFRVSDANLIELNTQKANLAVELEATNLDRNVTNWQYPNMLRQWQSQQGELVVHGLEFSATDMRFTANGKLNLDAAGQLNGQVTTQSKGLVELFDPEAYGILAPTIFGVANDEGEYKSLWQANAGTVSIGVAPLFFVPALF